MHFHVLKLYKRDIQKGSSVSFKILTDFLFYSPVNCFDLEIPVVMMLIVKHKFMTLQICKFGTKLQFSLYLELVISAKQIVLIIKRVYEYI